MEYTFAFGKLDVWKLAKEFSIEMYKLTKKFPIEERFGLVSQLNRATISGASNIAEGSARKSRKDKAHFYQIAYGSLMEVSSQLIIVRELGFIADQDYTSLRTKLHEISNKLNALYKSQFNYS